IFGARIACTGAHPSWPQIFRCVLKGAHPHTAKKLVEFTFSSLPKHPRLHSRASKSPPADYLLWPHGIELLRNVVRTVREMVECVDWSAPPFWDHVEGECPA